MKYIERKKTQKNTPLLNPLVITAPASRLTGVQDASENLTKVDNSLRVNSEGLQSPGRIILGHSSNYRYTETALHITLRSDSSAAFHAQSRQLIGKMVYSIAAFAGRKSLNFEP